MGQVSAGIELRGCSAVTVRESVFRDSSTGIHSFADRAPDARRERLEYVSNTFTNLAGAGIYSQISSDFQGVIDDLSGNTFSSIVTSDRGPAFALLLQGGSILRARNNRFDGNDVAIMLFTMDGTPLDATNVFDFGTASDPGQNDFRCNSAVLSKVLYYGGFDVAIDPPAPPGWVFNLQGNSWDRARPYVMTGAGIHDDEPNLPNGTDLFIGNGKPIGAVDIAGASRSSTRCAADHEEGPDRAQDAGPGD
jgi:hypothetical protein